MYLSLQPQHDRRAAFHPPSDFYVNVQSGLRTAMSTGFAFLWMGKGPFQGGLSFFAGVTAIVALGKSAGETIDRTLVSSITSLNNNTVINNQ